MKVIMKRFTDLEKKYVLDVIDNDLNSATLL